MKKIKKIIICSIVFFMLSLVVLPTTTILMENLNIDSKTILIFLSNITDSIIVKASNTDFEYSGNIYFQNGRGWWMEETEEEGVYIYSTSHKGRLLEYSVNGGEFTEFESGNSRHSYGTSVLNLPYNVNMVEIRDIETKTICVKALVINNQDYKIVIQDGLPLDSDIDGAGLYTIVDRNDIEYSINNGNDFQELNSRPWNSKINVENIFENKIIIRNKNTQEVIYKSPKLGEIEENIIYENGQTKVDFVVNGDAKDKTSYTYIFNEEEFTMNSVTLKEDSILKLKAHTDKEFTVQTIEKDINVKVVKTEKPSIKIDEEGNLVLTQGVIENDELANIYYSINNEVEKAYTDKVKLEVGTHTINAYQVTKGHEVKSLIETKEITIEEKVEDSNQENDKNDESDDKEDNNSEETNKEENNNQTSNEKENTEELNKNNTQKEDNENSPKTGDKVIMFVVLILVMVIANVLIKDTRR